VAGEHVVDAEVALELAVDSVTHLSHRAPGKKKGVSASAIFGLLWHDIGSCILGLVYAFLDMAAGWEQLQQGHWQKF